MTAAKGSKLNDVVSRDIDYRCPETSTIPPVYLRRRFCLPAFSRFVALRADGGIGRAMNSGGNNPSASPSASRSSRSPIGVLS